MRVMKGDTRSLDFSSHGTARCDKHHGNLIQNQKPLSPNPKP